MSLVGYECECVDHCSCFDHVKADPNYVDPDAARIAAIRARLSTTSPFHPFRADIEWLIEKVEESR